MQVGPANFNERHDSVFRTVEFPDGQKNRSVFWACHVKDYSYLEGIADVRVVPFDALFAALSKLKTNREQKKTMWRASQN